MSYHLYQTEGIVLSGANVGESNRYYHVLTKELGLVVASAQGVRELKSKLRPHLSDFSYVSLGLVRGRDFWRITNAEREKKFEHIFADKGKLSLVATIAQFLKRFLHGEEKNVRLFSTVEEGLSFLEKEKLDDEARRHLELILMARMLNALGYLGNDKKIGNMLEAPLSHALLRDTKSARGALLRDVNRALHSSHL
ncbi:MAG: DNA repair protein RecO [bacterium]|nr:DNA repair protein RecO [bacterium]